MAAALVLVAFFGGKGDGKCFFPTAAQLTVRLSMQRAADAKMVRMSEVTRRECHSVSVSCRHPAR